MKHIEIKILNPDEIKNAEKMMVCAARLTQSGHKISNLDDFMNVYNRPYSDNTVKNMVSLPHPTIQKFGTINIVVVGASRRFLAQITRHQNEVKFMSASLQYSDYSDSNDFAIPYEFIDTDAEQTYLADCRNSMNVYKQLASSNNNDSCGYLAPQGLRNVLIISATPFQWKHMISQRICRRNTDETRIVMLKIWTQLYKLSPSFFGNCGPFCLSDGACREGKMSCGKLIKLVSDESPAEQILNADYPKLICKEDKNNEDQGN